MNLCGPTRRGQAAPKTLRGNLGLSCKSKGREMGGKVVSLLKMAIQAVSQALLVVERSGKLRSIPKLIAGTRIKKATKFLVYLARTALVSLGLTCR